MDILHELNEVVNYLEKKRNYALANDVHKLFIKVAQNINLADPLNPTDVNLARPLPSNPKKKTAQLIGGQDLNETIGDEAKKLMSSVYVAANNPTNEIANYRSNYEENKNKFNNTEQQAIEKTFNDAINSRERQGIFTTDVYQPYDVMGADSTKNEVLKPDFISQAEDPLSDYLNLSYKQVIERAKHFLFKKNKEYADGLINAVILKSDMLTDPEKMALKNQYQRIKQNIGDFGGIQDDKTKELYQKSNNLISYLKTKYDVSNEELADRRSSSYRLIMNEIQKNPDVKLRNMALNLLRRIQMDFYKRK